MCQQRAGVRAGHSTGNGHHEVHAPHQRVTVIERGRDFHRQCGERREPTAETDAGTIERTFVFKVDGSKVTGETTSQMLGKSIINDGKLEGDTITFTIKGKFQDNEMTLNYKGKIEGDQIKFHVEGANGGPTIDYVAKKIS